MSGKLALCSCIDTSLVHVPVARFNFSQTLSVTRPQAKSFPFPILKREWVCLFCAMVSGDGQLGAAAAAAAFSGISSDSLRLTGPAGSTPPLIRRKSPPKKEIGLSV